MPDKIQLPLRVAHQSVVLGNNSTKCEPVIFFNDPFLLSHAISFIDNRYSETILLGLKLVVIG